MLQLLPRRLRRAASHWLRRPRVAEAGEIELTQRRVYILPTGAGLGFALLLAVLLIASVNYSLSMGFILTFALAACAMIDLHLAFRNLAWLRLSPGRGGAVFAGDDAQFELHLSNPGKHERHAIWIGFMQAGLPERAIDLGAQANCNLLLAAPARRRGWLAAPRIRLSTRFPLGLLRAWSYWLPDLQVLVYPTPEADAPPLPMGQEGQREHQGQAGQDEFAGVRPYQAGDSPRRLAWRQIARLAAASSETLVSKHFEGGAGSELRLDFALLPASLDIEQRLSRLARWVLEAEAQGRPYAFALGEIAYGPACGPAHQEACLRALALYREC